MKEIRKDNNIKIQFKDNIFVDGKIVDFLDDRILIKISDETLEAAKMMRELDDIMTVVETRLGIKQMHSCIMSTLNKNNCIIIENNEAVPVNQKRAYVRVAADFSFKVKNKDEIPLKAQCVNISAGGIAFRVLNGMLNLDDEVSIVLGKNEFKKEIECLSKIIKINKDIYIAQYIDLSLQDENKIVKYIFSLMTAQ